MITEAPTPLRRSLRLVPPAVEPPTGRHHPVLTARRGHPPAGAVPRLAPGRYLAVENGAEMAVIPLHGEQVTIGRGLGADLCFDDVSVSRRHARLFLAHEAALIDERSLNGVWVNGMRISRAVLRDGDSIAIGAVRARFLDIAPSTPPEAA